MRKRSAKQWARLLLHVLEGQGEYAQKETMTGFVALLEEAHVRSRWREIARALNIVWRERYGAAEIVVSAPTDLSSDTFLPLEKAFPRTSITQKRIPELLGGAKVQVDDRVIDGTVLGTLDYFKQVLLQDHV